MLSTEDLERLIAVKRREIEDEKMLLDLSLSQSDDANNLNHIKNNALRERDRQVRFADSTGQSERNAGKSEKEDARLVEAIPADLERYIRRYLGLPVMLRAGEYSPNNPRIRSERAGGDAFRGLGEYERTRGAVRRLQQRQYREFLDQQAKLKQEAKEAAEKERLEEERREREREEREREREEKRRLEELERERTFRESIPERRAKFNGFGERRGSYGCSNKVDTGVQVDGLSRPLSVAVQTDDIELFSLSAPNCQLTRAERELSPRAVGDHTTWRKTHEIDDGISTTKTNREKLVSDLRHAYMPSIFDADAIQRRNLQAEKEAAARRQFYQQELKDQILEQQRIKEERKNREKMLEQAEMRRLEEQLRMLRLAQEKEIGKHHDITNEMKENATDYEKKRTALQKEIDIEQRALLRTSSQASKPLPKRNTFTSKSDNIPRPSKLPFFYPKIVENKTTNREKLPFSTNIPDDSIFSPNYDVDSYLRRNLNPSKESLYSRFDNVESESKLSKNFDIDSINYNGDITERILPKDYQKEKTNVIVEKAVVHDTKDKYEPSFMKKEEITTDCLPVLRQSPKIQAKNDDTNILSDAMKIVDDKWKVPVVQKNILKTLPDNEGKNVSILTQLGSIRRQLQLEQLKLDNMMPKDDGV